MKKGLGRGLNSLFGEYEEENSTEKVVETKIEQVIVNEPNKESKPLPSPFFISNSLT